MLSNTLKQQINSILDAAGYVQGTLAETPSFPATPLPEGATPPASQVTVTAYPKTLGDKMTTLKKKEFYDIFEPVGFTVLDLRINTSYLAPGSQVMTDFATLLLEHA